MGGHPVTLLDGDIVRRNLSNELGFSKEHRDINVRRIGFVASEITKNRGIAICAPIAPYSEIRRQIRELIESYGDLRKCIWQRRCRSAKAWIGKVCMQRHGRDC